MKNNSGKRAWKCIVHLLWHMFLLLDFHWLYYLGRNLFLERKGILQMAAYWKHCEKEEGLYQTYTESNVQLRISLRSFFCAVMSIVIFPACCSTWLLHFSQRDASEGLKIVLIKTVIGTEWWWWGERWPDPAQGSTCRLLAWAKQKTLATKMSPLLLRPFGSNSISMIFQAGFWKSL